MDLKADLRSFILANLPYDRNDPAVVAEINGKPVDSLLVAYHNWLNRFLQPVPRTVHLSREYSANPLRAQYPAALSDILDAIAKGRDLNPRLSKLVRYGYVANSSSATRDKDLMLNDWGVHHLHLGTGPDPKDPYFIDRTGELLFVMFRPTAAFVLDIFDHQAWTDRDVARIAVGNWPNADLFLELKGVLGTSWPMSEKEHATVRRAGVTSPVEIDGRVYVGRGMLSTAGTGVMSVRAADQLLDRIEAFEHMAQAEPQTVARLLSQAGVQPPAAPEFEFVFLTDGYGVREKQTGAVIILSD